MLSQDATIQGEFSSNHLSYLDSYWKNIDCQERKTLTDVITTRFFSWRTVVAESNRSPPSKQRLKETIAFIYFTKGAPSRCTNPKPLSHWLFKLQEREDLDFLRDLSPTLNLDAKDKLGNSALHWAVRNRAPKVVSALMSLDANPNVSNKAGDYPLHFAVHKDDPNSITALRALLNNQKINPSPRDRRNYTPLDIAVLHKKLGCVVALTENGARVNNKTFSLARDSLTGEQIETDMIQHLVLCRWNQNKNHCISSIYALSGTLLAVGSAMIGAFYITGLFLELAHTTNELALANISESRPPQAFEDYFG